MFALLFSPTAAYAQEEVDLTSTKDNTLYEDNAGALSNGAGEYLFVGTTGTGAVRRALLAFDIESAVPEGAVIEDVALTLNMSRTISNGHPVTLHRVTSDWGEGDSEAPGEEGGGVAAASGDATWIHTFFDTESWEAPGGDYVETASAMFDVAGLGSYSASSDGMIEDVQQWVDEPSSNFGWIILGNEAATASAKRFDSRENSVEANRPRLTITYTTNISAETDELPHALRLEGSFPNPFSGATTVRFELDLPQTLTLRLYDVLGREVRSIDAGTRAAGAQEIRLTSDGLPSGTYLYCLESASSECGRLMIVR